MKKVSLLFSLLLALSLGARAQESFALANSSTGTTVSTLTKVVVVGGVPQAQIMATTDTLGAVGAVAPNPNSGAGTTGQVVITRSGIVPIVFDNTTVAGDYCQISATVAGNCHDVGATRPTSGQIIGIVIQIGGSAGTYNVLLDKSILPAASATAPICQAFGSSDTISSAGAFATACPIPSTAISGPGQILQVVIHGVLTTTTGSPVANFQINGWGTTGLCISGGAGSAMSLGTSLTAMGWDVTCYVQIVTTGAPGTAFVSGSQSGANAAGGAFVTHLLCNANPCTASTSSVTTNSTQNVTVQETATMVAGQSFTLQWMFVRNY